MYRKAVPNIDNNHKCLLSSKSSY